MGANASHEPLGGDLGGVVRPPPARRRTMGSSIRKSIRKRRQKWKEKRQDENKTEGQTEGSSDQSAQTMDKLRRSLSLKKKKDEYIPEAAKPHIWQTDEASVRAGTCSFPVKYLGCVEVFESRGMPVCEEALKVLRNSRRRPVRGILYVSGDGLRVVDDDTKGLIVDQTIEKVSFCAPDRNHERGFSYICRDGTTRRWMCHGFVASKESGERLSHAVGCAFAVCLERKQKRDQDSGVTMTFDKTTSTFTRMGSFRQMTVTERLSDPQECKPTENEIPVKKVENPHAIARPHATPQLLQRQGSFRVFGQLNHASPFKRQLSLRLSDLPSNLERTRSLSLDNSSSVEDAANILNNNPNLESLDNGNEPIQPLRSRFNVNGMAPIPEAPAVDKEDPVSAMCQQVSAGLSLLSNIQDSYSNKANSHNVSPNDETNSQVSELLECGIDWSLNKTTNGSDTNNYSLDASSNNSLSKGEEWLAQLRSSPLQPIKNEAITEKRAPSLSQLRSSSLGAAPSNTPTQFEPHKTTQKKDPFDAEWAVIASSAANPNNPFIQTPSSKAFEIHM